MKCSLVIPISISTEVTKPFALLTQVLRVPFRGIPCVQSLRFFQGTLCVRIHNDVTILTLLTCVGPTIGAHPAAVTLWTSVFTKTTPSSLVWCLPCNSNTITRYNCQDIALVPFAQSVFVPARRGYALSNRSLHALWGIRVIGQDCKETKRQKICFFFIFPF